MLSESRKVSAPFQHSEKGDRNKWVQRPPIKHVILALRGEGQLPAIAAFQRNQEKRPSDPATRDKMCSQVHLDGFFWRAHVSSKILKLFARSPVDASHLRAGNFFYLDRHRSRTYRCWLNHSR